jgi:hypothetical protein
MTEPGRGAESVARRGRRVLLVVLGGLLVYYAVPVGERPSGHGVALSALGLVVGTALLGWLIVRQVQRLARASDTGEVRLDSLILLIVLVVPMFALGYHALEHADHGQFDSLSTKTDALYFTVSTLATVGFGDVHATGQLARGLVTLQIAFDLVFVAGLVSMVAGRLRERTAAHRESPPGAGDP